VREKPPLIIGTLQFSPDLVRDGERRELPQQEKKKRAAHLAQTGSRYFQVSLSGGERRKGTKR